ncbi:glucoamylase family protein [Oleiagrimonas sp. MCCC 1A03011]|uniref:glucoamylase family protein n=1 Tax=Oleiagrimonas sp. MCCC 1A03011 TaxID=1926883 RepID=UPI000DC35FAF|nr:glucoamylase family protein [Oleiagrimonas sp. MCCC 1A03011]RAP57193.1 Tat pathway signal protein [Oleiagrimonas sp. MCCC 1A03011]
MIKAHPLHSVAAQTLLALFVLIVGIQFPATAAADQTPETVPVHALAAASSQAQLDDLERRTFEFFWKTTNPGNGLAPDHFPLREQPFASIAADGFALTAYGIGVERGYITREQAIQRVLTTLKFFANAPQGTSEDGDTGYRGFFYHFLDMRTGKRYGRWVELSTVDTTLLLGGVLFCQSYFDRDTAQEREIRKLADTIYRRVDWTWAQARPPLISMGWTPGGKFIPHDWTGYDEGMLIYILALGSPTHPVKPDAWKAWTDTYSRSWGTYQGQTYLAFAPLFGHQYSHAWVDFRGIQDDYMRGKGIDYFINSRRAALAHQAYAIANPHGFKGYGKNVWGLTASDGPGHFTWVHNGETVHFRGYSARGAGLSGSAFDDGTLAPTAALGSIAFTPKRSLAVLDTLLKRYGKAIYRQYGFVDAFNPSFAIKGAKPKHGDLIPGAGWVDDAYLGIDQGPILLMIENYRSGFVWRVMRKNPYIRRGLLRAGFRGGWLDKAGTAP